MADDLGISNHLTERDGVWQFVRRVPTDVRDAFPFARVQRSLRTRSEREAREKAVALDRLWDDRFAQAREQKGLSGRVQSGPDPVETADWSWTDWEALARWFGAALAEADWGERLGSVTGRVLAFEPDLADLPWRSAEVVREHIERGRAFRGMAVDQYAEQRAGYVQGHVRRLGITLTKTSPHHLRFMAACLQAELTYLHLFQERESRRGGLGHPHPDAIEGRWRRKPKDVQPIVFPTPPSEPLPAIGKTLQECLTKWIEKREKEKKLVRPEHLREARSTIAAFEKQAKVRDIGEIRRRHVLAFRDHLCTTTDYAAQTINKKVSFVTTLMSTALNAGWIETSLGEKLALAVPEDEDRREPYGDDHLGTIFSHPTFTAGHRATRAKACGELQFWLPLISCLHGMVSSEIIQLGPDTVVPHPDYPDILCFNVTTAGDRRTKTLDV